MTLADVFEGRARWTVEVADCRFAMSCMADASVDAIVCDPPYELNFMNRKWDSTGIAFNVEVWREALRVLKPGGHLLAFGGTRTYHRLACAIEDAGFDIRDSVAWLYGSGFPKSLNVSKAIDAAAGAERPVIGRALGAGSSETNSLGRFAPTYAATAAATAAATEAEGYGTALKPAFEPVIVARKPLDGTVAANWLKHGTGALNIDGCRIGTDENLNGGTYSGGERRVTSQPDSIPGARALQRLANACGKEFAQPLGRWPANVALTHSEGCERVGTRQAKRNVESGAQQCDDSVTCYGDGIGGRSTTSAGETVESWQCAPGCPVAELDAQSGSGTSKPFPENVATGAVLPLTFRSAGGYSDTGGASRFFFTAKASRAERDAGLEDFEPKSGGEATDRKDGSAGLESPRTGAGRHGGARNSHPTIKPVDLMRWLVRLVSRPGSLILDPFCGSGTTGVATMLEGEGRRFIGLELEPLHVDFARARIAHKIGGTFEREVIPERPYEKRQLSIFDRISGHDEALP